MTEAFRLPFPVYKLNREGTQPEKMCVIVFEYVKGRGGTVNRARAYGKANFKKFTRTPLCCGLFSDKFRCYNLQLH